MEQTPQNNPLLALEMFYALVADIQRRHSNYTQAGAIAAAKATAEGARLWRQAGKDDAERTAKSRLFVQRVSSVGLVDRGACAGADVMIFKNKETPMQTTTPDMRVFRDVVWAAIEDVGASIKKDNPALTNAQANAEALKTGEGERLTALYNDPDAALTVSDYMERKRQLAKRRAAGFETWDQAVDNCAKLIADRDGIAYADALGKVRTEYPGVWSQYESGAA